MSHQNVTQDAIKDILLEHVTEQRRKRRWGIFFKLVALAWGLFILLILFSNGKVDNIGTSNSHTALIDVSGPIFDKASASADNIVVGLRRAFENKNSKAVIMRINSPGGSPVQADYIYSELQRLRAKHPNKKVYAVCTDLCASAAYYIAAAADDIYANPNSLVGSIGVLFNGFGFVGTLNKLGVERRLLTAGSHKGYMDPFSPSDREEEAFTKVMLNQIHLRFISAVKTGRGKRLVSNPQIFSGLIWTGMDAKNLGLVDGYGSAGTIAREVIKESRMVNYTVKPSYVEQIAKRFGEAFSDQFTTKLGLTPHVIS